MGLWEDQVRAMPVCPNCGSSEPDEAAFCAKCGSLLRPHEPIAVPSSRSVSPPLSPSYPIRGVSGASVRTYAILGSVSAVLSLFVLPEVFGTVAIVLGAYVWRREAGNRGLTMLILGIVFMLTGIYFTSAFALIDVVPLY